jgi:DNA-binding transcriptional MocR family regulator
MDAALRTGFRGVTWRLIRPIWRLENVTASQRLVLLALASFTDQRGANAYPSQATLARMCCCNRSTVQRALAALIRRGLISPRGKGRKGTIRYSVNISMQQDGPHDAPATRRTVQHNPSKINPSNSTSREYFDSSGSDYEGPKLDQYGRNTESIHEQAMRLHRARRQQT